MATKWFKIGSRRPQDVPRWLQVGQDGRELAQSGSKRGPRSATWAKMALKLIQQGLKITSLSYFVPTSFSFPSLFFSFGEPFPLEKKALVKYPSCIAIVRFSLLYSNYQTLSYCSICQTSLPLYYLPYTSPCITLVTSFPCIVLVYDLSNASSCKTLVNHFPVYIYIYPFPFLSFPFISFPFLSFALLCFPFLSFPFLSNRMGGLPKAIRKKKHK